MASELKVNTLTGVSTAGSIAVTGEGNSTTTNLQGGLAKCWCTVTQASTHVLDDSFNVSSIADGGAGETTVNFTNTMSSSNWCSNVTSGSENNIRGIFNANNTTRLKIESYQISSNSTAADAADVCGTVHGDLA